MRWMLLSMAAVGLTFFIAYQLTGAIWAGMNAAGVVSLVYIVGLTIVVARSSPSGMVRWTLPVLVGIVIIGTAAQWIIMDVQTNWQYDTLQAIRRRIFHYVAESQLEPRAMKTFSAFYQQDNETKMTLGSLFDQLNPALRSGGPELDTLSYEDSAKIYVSIKTDTLVVLLEASSRIEGNDPKFINFDGRTGFVQDKVSLSTKGIYHEIEN